MGTACIFAEMAVAGEKPGKSTTLFNRKKKKGKVWTS